MQQADLLVIDEVSMGNKQISECLAKSLQDVRKNNKLFGRLKLLLAGGWKQILSLIRHGSRPQNVDAALEAVFHLGPCVNTGT